MSLGLLGHTGIKSLQSRLGIWTSNRDHFDILFENWHRILLRISKRLEKMPFNCCRIQVSDEEKKQGQKDELHKIYKSIRTCNDQALTKLKNFINEYSNDKFQFDRFRHFKFHSKTEGDLTLLHAAALYHNDCSIVQVLAEMFPELIPVERTETYQGQTALHITVGKGRHQSTKHILENARDNDIEKMFSARATGRRCTSSIMLGETPVSVAFLTFDIEMVKLLLKYGAKLDEVNSKGDTIIHSLIKYAAIDKGKIPKVIQMLNYFTNKINKRNKSDKLVSKTGEKETLQQMWFKENNELVTPLKLAVSAGLAEVFEAMMKMENVFYFPNTRDGSFDTRYYDVTEIDPNAHFKYITDKQRYTFCNKMSNIFTDEVRLPSVIEMLSRLEMKESQPFLKYDIIKMNMSIRWEKYKKIYWIFGVVHLVMMLLFTSAAFSRKEALKSVQCDSTNIRSHDLPYRDYLYSGLLLLYSLFIIASEIYKWMHLLLNGIETFRPWKLFSNSIFRCKKAKKKWLAPVKHLSNSLYSLVLLVLALALILYYALLYSKVCDVIDLSVIIILSGSGFFFFFFRGFEKFSIYTVLFQKIIFGDLIRFGLIIILAFTSFTFAMYISIPDKDEIEQFSNFENTTLTMFGLMLGMKDFDFLDKVDSQSQRLVAVIYVLFIITTYILLINSLIAMMSKTFVIEKDERKMIARLQRSSVTLFLNPFMCGYHLNEKPNSEFANEDRFYIAIKSDDIGKFVGENIQIDLNNNTLTLKNFRNDFFKSLKGKDKTPRLNMSNGDKIPNNSIIKNVEALKQTTPKAKYNVVGENVLMNTSTEPITSRSNHVYLDIEDFDRDFDIQV
ncbi:hypothetical protein Btru_050221 [Bulinus truncatus]|nr:hypothetical protein Btru_050221 [Bulinus truncatus]